jgi:hypothetical protein
MKKQVYYLRDYRGPKMDRGFKQWLFIRRSKDFAARFFRFVGIVYFCVYLPFLFISSAFTSQEPVRERSTERRPARQLRQRDILHPVVLPGTPTASSVTATREQVLAGGFSARRQP